MFSLTITAVVTLLLHSPLTQGQIQNMVYKFTGLRDRQFQDGQLFTITGVTSAVQCARLCSANTQCHTFTFTPEGSQFGSGSRSGSCQAHNVVVTSESSSTSVVGAVTYQLFKNGDRAWLGSSCVANTACARPPTKCLQGQCTCIPGYYFSLRSNMCVQQCADADLLDVFLEYTSMVLDGEGFLSGATPSSLQECKNLCRATHNCSAVVYKQYPYCSLFSISRATMIQRNFRDAAENVYFCQRMCA